MCTFPFHFANHSLSQDGAMETVGRELLVMFVERSKYQDVMGGGASRDVVIIDQLEHVFCVPRSSFILGLVLQRG